MKRCALNLLVFLAVMLISVSCGGGGNGEDATEDGDLPQETDGTDARDGTDGTDPDTTESESPPDASDVPAPEQMDQTDQEEDAPPDLAQDDGDDTLEEDAAEEEPEPTPVCGNGTVEGSEACDDSNTVTEPCGGGTDCAADCSLLEATCGDRSTDAGEACDDGDTDSMNDCTTSCTSNDHGIGSPCTCTGGSCSDTNFTAGTINGCSGVTIPPGSGGLLACLRSMHEPTSGYDTYYAEGYCTIMAVTCSGALCMFVPQPGDFDTVACPEGSYLYEDSRTVMGSTTVTSRSCLRICTSDADCRRLPTPPRMSATIRGCSARKENQAPSRNESGSFSEVNGRPVLDGLGRGVPAAEEVEVEDRPRRVHDGKIVGPAARLRH